MKSPQNVLGNRNRGVRKTKAVAQRASHSRILDECHLAVALVEVTQRSLELLEIAHSEQEVLKRTLESIWSVHDWIDGLSVDEGQVVEP